MREGLQRQRHAQVRGLLAHDADPWRRTSATLLGRLACNARRWRSWPDEGIESAVPSSSLGGDHLLPDGQRGLAFAGDLFRERPAPTAQVQPRNPFEAGRLPQLAVLEGGGDCRRLRAARGGGRATGQLRREAAAKSQPRSHPAYQPESESPGLGTAAHGGAELAQLGVQPEAAWLPRLGPWLWDGTPGGAGAHCQVLRCQRGSSSCVPSAGARRGERLQRSRSRSAQLG
mmetsp:Transcript_3296/g.13216  ORF Transcript_3296/g.13216 Transcript_3296/m.13216 type:complete len:230 (-) Transcript_3296:2729-3418(-)